MDAVDADTDECDRADGGGGGLATPRLDDNDNIGLVDETLGFTRLVEVTNDVLDGMLRFVDVLLLLRFELMLLLIVCTSAAGSNPFVTWYRFDDAEDG